MKKYLWLLALLVGCVPATGITKPASAEVRLLLNVGRSQLDAQTRNALGLSLREIGYTVFTDDTLFRNFGSEYNETLAGDRNEATRLIGNHKATYGVFVLSQPAPKDPPLLSGFSRYAEIRAIASIVDGNGRLVGRVETLTTGGTFMPNASATDAIVAALPVAMKAIAAKVNEVINP